MVIELSKKENEKCAWSWAIFQVFFKCSYISIMSLDDKFPDKII